SRTGFPLLQGHSGRPNAYREGCCRRRKDRKIGAHGRSAILCPKCNRLRGRYRESGDRETQAGSPPSNRTLAGVSTTFGSELLSDILAPAAGAGFARLNVIVVDSPPTTLASENLNAVRVCEFSPPTLSDCPEGRIPNPLGLVEGFWAGALPAANDTRPARATSLVAPRHVKGSWPTPVALLIHEISHPGGNFG